MTWLCLLALYHLLVCCAQSVPVRTPKFGYRQQRDRELLLMPAHEHHVAACGLGLDTSVELQWYAVQPWQD